MFSHNPHPQLFNNPPPVNLFPQIQQPQRPLPAIQWGLCKSGSDDLLPLETIDVSVDIVNNVATVFFDKTYFNNSDQFIETDYYFPISSDACFDSFQAKFGEVTITGVIKKKQEAKQDYQKAIQEGRTAAISEIVPSGNDAMRLKIGNIPPQTNITIKYSYIQKLECALNKFWCFQLFSSATSAPSFDWRNIFDLNYQSPPIVFGKNSENCVFNIKVNIQSSSPLSAVKSPSHDIVQDFGNESHTCTVQLDQNKLHFLGKDFVLLFSNGNENKMDYVLAPFEDGYCAMVNFVADFDTEISANQAYDSLVQAKEPAKSSHSMSTVRGEYIFLIDRSGSMSGGKIQRAKNSLLLFLKSLPTDCFFNVIGFGSHFQLMYPESVEYSEESIESSLQKIEQLNADMGGTNIYHPLKKVYETPLKKGFPRFIFLLTDGEVENTYEVLNLIKENVNFARVFSIGIGSDFSQVLITQSAINGRGKHEFVVESQEIPAKVISLLNASLSPCYFDISLNANNFDAVVKSMTPNPNDVAFLLNGQVLTFFLLLRKEAFENQKMTLSLRLYDSTKKDYRSIELILDQENSLDHPQVCKLAIHEMIRALENQKKELGPAKTILLWFEQADIEASLTELSLKYQILCKETAFFLEFIGDEFPKADAMQIENRGNAIVRLLPGCVVPQSQRIVNPSQFLNLAQHNAPTGAPTNSNPNIMRRIIQPSRRNDRAFDDSQQNNQQFMGPPPQNNNNFMGSMRSAQQNHHHSMGFRGPNQQTGSFGYSGSQGLQQAQQKAHQQAQYYQQQLQQRQQMGGMGGMRGSVPQNSTSGGLFGNSSKQNNYSQGSPQQLGSFGNSNSQQQQQQYLQQAQYQQQQQQAQYQQQLGQQQQMGGMGGMFKSVPQNNSSGGLFGSGQQNNQLGGMSGNFEMSTGSQQQTGGGMFGHPQQQTGGGLFGSAPQSNASSGGLFGNSGMSPGSQQQTGGGLFGHPQQKTGGGLFGSAPQSSASSGGLFGNSASGNLFGGSAPQQNQQMGGSLFGNNSSQNNLFNSNNSFQSQNNHIQPQISQPQNQQNPFMGKQQQTQQMGAPSQISYMDVVMEQRIAGYWDGANQRLVSMIFGNGVLPQVPQDFPDVSQDLVLNAWMTILVLNWLEKNWSSERNAWSLVHQKGCEWLKAKGINYEEVKNLGN